MRAGALALALACAGHASAQDITLQSPIDCDLTDTCFIQQYMDRDSGPGALDFMCADLSYDTHSGTDFALPSLAMMAAGVAVRAAAPGRVAGIRDGMADIGYSQATSADIQDRECGNGVRIEHAGGWTTQYCHLRQGSVSVGQGQDVAAGDTLGLVGMSGRAQFPHVHLRVSRDGALVDPFDSDETLDCSAPGDSTLWDETPPYRPGGLIALGISDHVPEFAQIKAGNAHRSDLTLQAEALVVWGYGFGLRAGDVMRLSLDGPDGTVIAQDVVMGKAQAQAFRAIGKRLRRSAWPAGVYTGTASLMRDDTLLETRRISLPLN